MIKKIRLRCPICGMLVWQNRLDEHWEFEILIQKTTALGRGRGFQNEYVTPRDEEGVFFLKLALAQKLEAVARELRGEAFGERRDEYSERQHAGRDTSALYDSPSELHVALTGIDKVIAGSAVDVQNSLFTISPAFELGLKIVQDSIARLVKPSGHVSSKSDVPSASERASMSSVAYDSERASRSSVAYDSDRGSFSSVSSELPGSSVRTNVGGEDRHLDTESEREDEGYVEAKSEV